HQTPPITGDSWPHKKSTTGRAFWGVSGTPLADRPITAFKRISARPVVLFLGGWGEPGRGYLTGGGWVTGGGLSSSSRRGRGRASVGAWAGPRSWRRSLRPPRKSISTFCAAGRETTTPRPKLG